MSRNTASISLREAEFESVFNEANRAGFAAGEAARPQAMIVSERVAGGRSWHVPEGACGFAWVNISPGTCPFARWLVKNNHAHKAYRGGVDIWISAHGQSIERKEAHAYKMAQVIAERLGVKAYPDSRLD